MTCYLDFCRSDRQRVAAPLLASNHPANPPTFGQVAAATPAIVLHSQQPDCLCCSVRYLSPNNVTGSVGK